MAEYKNFYESIKEARMRLKGTIVMYDNSPVYILNICDHKSDGIFRVYMDPVDEIKSPNTDRYPVPYENSMIPTSGDDVGSAMDKFLTKNNRDKDMTIMRKMMNSPLFNKFRPFPLGMCNYGDSVLYLQRMPNRHTQQGLIKSMIKTDLVSVGSSISKDGSVRHTLQTPNIRGKPMAACYKGIYPSAEQVIENLDDPLVTNTGSAFNREFAILRGPLEIKFLAYKKDIVGFLPKGNLSEIVIGKKFKYTAEVVDDLNIFKSLYFQ